MYLLKFCEKVLMKVKLYKHLITNDIYILFYFYLTKLLKKIKIKLNWLIAAIIILICKMPIKIIDHGSAQYQQMIDLRMEILRKPLGLHLEADDLEKEKEDILIGAFEDDDMVACCVLTKLSPELCKLRQMAVHQRMQRNGVGHAIMQFAENVARDAGFKTMTMHARKTAELFYEKIGYAPHGDEFIEVTLPHIEMRKKLI